MAEGRNSKGAELFLMGNELSSEKFLLLCITATYLDIEMMKFQYLNLFVKKKHWSENQMDFNNNSSWAGVCSYAGIFWA